MTMTFEQIPEAISQLQKEIAFIKIKLLELLQLSESLPPEKLLTVSEIADYLHLSKATIYMKASNEDIPFMKKGKRLYFCRDEIDNWVRQGKLQESSAQEISYKELIRPRKFLKCS